jgi:hypothetical protein
MFFQWLQLSLGPLCPAPQPTAQPIAPAIGDPRYPLSGVSLQLPSATNMFRKVACRSCWLYRGSGCEADAFSIEVGGRAKRRHLQGTSMIRAPKCRADCIYAPGFESCGARMVGKSMRDLCGFDRGGATLCIPGVCIHLNLAKDARVHQKGRGQIHFNGHIHSYSTEELEQAGPSCRNIQVHISLCRSSRAR